MIAGPLKLTLKKIFLSWSLAYMHSKTSGAASMTLKRRGQPAAVKVKLTWQLASFCSQVVLRERPGS